MAPVPATPALGAPVIACPLQYGQGARTAGQPSLLGDPPLGGQYVRDLLDRHGSHPVACGESILPKGTARKPCR